MADYLLSGNGKTQNAAEQDLTKKIETANTQLKKANLPKLDDPVSNRYIIECAIKNGEKIDCATALDGKHASPDSFDDAKLHANITFGDKKYNITGFIIEQLFSVNKRQTEALRSSPRPPAGNDTQQGNYLMDSITNLVQN